MINLIPPTARTHVTREYWLRVASVWLLLATAGLGVTIILLFPAYVFIQLQLQPLTASIPNTDFESNEFTMLRDEIVKANQVATLLMDVADITPASILIKEVEKLTSAEINITDISLVRNGRLFESMSVSGVATTRESLANFKSRLETQAMFEAVDLPLSNLAKDQDVTFFITITLKTE